MGEKMINIPNNITELNEFEALALHHAMRKIQDIRTKNKVQIHTIERKDLGIVFKFKFTDKGNMQVNWERM